MSTVQKNLRFQILLSVMSRKLQRALPIITLVIISACNTEPAEQLASTSETKTKDIGHDITVYKSPTCGCCTGWVDYLRDEGFTVTAIDHDDVDSVKAQLGLPSPELASCHTAVIDGYIVEGHVPADDIRRLLSERPLNVKGLSAPGMPTMSPGMASREPKDYDVISFTASGDTSVFARY